MKILPSSYLPSISYFWELHSSQQGSVIDTGEHFVKRSIRNRARIMTAQGVMELTVPVRRANTPRQPMHAIEIDNSRRWQHQHWNAIMSAYRSSPYFEHFAPYIEPLYKREYERLTEFNSALMGVIIKLLRIGGELQYSTSTTYVEAQPADLDLRPKGEVERGYVATPYIQVFSDRLPFEPNLSILDLLFCEGTSALEFLGASHR